LNFAAAPIRRIESLKRSLLHAEESADIEWKRMRVLLEVQLEELPSGTFVISPNAPVKQIWISACPRVSKLDWSDAAEILFSPRPAKR